MARRRRHRLGAVQRKALDPRPRLVAATVRALLEGLPAELRPEAMREVRGVFRSLAKPPERTRMEPGEAENEADVAIEILGQDPKVRRLTGEWSAARWRKLVKRFHEVVFRKLKALERRRFRSRKAMDKAIGDAVMRTIAEIAKDPAAWLEKHAKDG